MRKLKSILKGIALGGLKAVPLVGGIAEEVKKSVETEEAHSPKGQVDYARLLGYGIVGVIILAVIFGKIDVETAKELIKKLNIYSFFS